LPFAEQAKAAVALLQRERELEDHDVAAERAQADELLHQQRRERREKLTALLTLERQATDLHLALERKSGDLAVTSRDDFLAQASHDLAALMTASDLYLAVLVREADKSEHARRLAPHLAALMEISAQMQRLNSDLVDVAALDAGKLTVALRPHSAAELVATAAAFFEPIARGRGRSLTVVPGNPDMRVMVDAVRAVQVLGNLLSNAIKFSPPGGSIPVGLEATGSEVSFFVADSGPGVPAEQAEHIFERFTSSGGSPQSLGLGLFISKRLVDAHGGRMWFESNGGHGAVFRFTLPRATG
jgi:chemotaxis family two-component system sensor kinase Cph1